jgi:hypothetical protein
MTSKARLTLQLHLRALEMGCAIHARVSIAIELVELKEKWGCGKVRKFIERSQCVGFASQIKAGARKELRVAAMMSRQALPVHRQNHLNASPSAMTRLSPMLSMLDNGIRPSATVLVLNGSRRLGPLDKSLSPGAALH